jgi:ABC-type Mn2+/Zn2+ transport system permease subunit
MWILHTAPVNSRMQFYSNLCTVLCCTLASDAMAHSVYFGVALATTNSINIVIQLD